MPRDFDKDAEGDEDGLADKIKKHHLGGGVGEDDLDILSSTDESDDDEDDDDDVDTSFMDADSL